MKDCGCHFSINNCPQFVYRSQHLFLGLYVLMAQSLMWDRETDTPPRQLV